MMQRIDVSMLTDTLRLAAGESVQKVDIDPVTGDYRVFHVGMSATPTGGQILSFELHRQGPGFERRIFNVLTLALAPGAEDGLSLVEAITSDAGLKLSELPHLLSCMAEIVAALKAGKRPQDFLMLPLLSKAGQVLWTQPLPQRLAS